MARYTASLHVPVWVDVPDGTDPAEMVATLIAQTAESNAPGILVDKYGVVDGPNGERLHVSFGEEGYGGATIVNIQPDPPVSALQPGAAVRIKGDPAEMATVRKVIGWFNPRGWLYEVRSESNLLRYGYYEDELESVEGADDA